MQNDKFILLNERIITPYGGTLYRIEAIKSFPGVESGQLGGFIETESNLSTDDNSWVSGNARVYGDAQVSGNARVCGDALVSGDAQVYGDAQVSGDVMAKVGE